MYRLSKAVPQFYYSILIGLIAPSPPPPYKAVDVASTGSMSPGEQGISSSPQLTVNVTVTGSSTVLAVTVSALVWL